jgi:hypothetical protein
MVPVNIPGLPSLRRLPGAPQVVPSPTPPGLPRDLYKIADAALRANLSRSCIYRRFERGLVGFYGFPGAYLVSLSELLPRVMRTRASPPQPRRRTKTGKFEAGRESERGRSPGVPPQPEG